MKTFRFTKGAKRLAASTAGIAIIAAFVWTAATRSTDRTPDGSQTGPGNSDERDRDQSLGMREPRSSGKTASRETKHTHKGVLTFADGEVHVINWHRQPAPAGTAPPYGPHYDRLMSLAENGDAFAAFELFDILTTCENAFETREELEAAVDTLQQTHTVRLPAWEEEKRIADGSAIAGLITNMENWFGACEGITAKQKDMATHWLDIAASADISTAKIAFAGMQQESEVRIATYYEAWKLGDVEGLMGLSHELQQLYVSGVVPANNVNAYAHLLAYAKLKRLGLEGHGPVVARHLENVKNILDSATSSMQEWEIQEARELAKAIITGNPNCCYAM